MNAPPHLECYFARPPGAVEPLKLPVRLWGVRSVKFEAPVWNAMLRRFELKATSVSRTELEAWGCCKCKLGRYFVHVPFPFRNTEYFSDADFDHRRMYELPLWPERFKAAYPRFWRPPGSPALEALGLKAGASAAEIRRAFRLKALAAHPDRGGTDAAFVALQRSYADALKAAHP